jgi:hypothetical protein
MICGTKTKVICGCVRAICSSTGGVTCWAWHFEAVASGAADEGPVPWQRDKRSSQKWSELATCRICDVLRHAWVVQWPSGSVELPSERLPCSACSYLKWPLCIQITSILPGLKLIQSQNKSHGLKPNVMNFFESIVLRFDFFLFGRRTSANPKIFHFCAIPPPQPPTLGTSNHHQYLSDDRFMISNRKPVSQEFREYVPCGQRSIIPSPTRV